MSPMNQIKKVFYNDSEITESFDVSLSKGKFKPVEFKIETKSGNKKITSIYNLHQFSLDITLLQDRIKKNGCNL